MKFTTQKAKEKHLNALYADIYSEQEAMDNFIYLTNKNRSGGHTTEKNIRTCFYNHTLGSLLRKYDPIAFNCSD